MKTPLSVLALSGSLRRASANTTMLTMAGACAPPAMRVTLHRGLGELPLFNPDLEPTAPAAVLRLQRDIAQADAVLIASPEYAHGVSSVMKNALDWMVSSGVLVDKPVVLWNASPRASHAMAALHETLSVMAVRLVPEAGLVLWVKAPDDASPQINPDPSAMCQALLALQRVLQGGAALRATQVA
jgi:chromate reductase, NAD(P)H dehydrogenase (quinone)